MWDGTADDNELVRMVREVAPSLCSDRGQLSLALSRLPLTRDVPIPVSVVADTLLDYYFANGGSVPLDSGFSAPEPVLPVPAPAAHARSEPVRAPSSQSQEDALKLARQRLAMRWLSQHSQSSNERHAKPVSVSQEQQIRQARERARERWLRTAAGRPGSASAFGAGAKARVCTLETLEQRDKMRQAAERAMDEHGSYSDVTEGGRARGVVHTIAGFSDPTNIGRRALELTNEFRAKNGLPKLTWSQMICDIGVGHSKGLFHCSLGLSFIFILFMVAFLC